VSYLQKKFGNQASKSRSTKENESQMIECCGKTWPQQHHIQQVGIVAIENTAPAVSYPIRGGAWISQCFY